MVACGSHVRYFWGGRKRERPFTPVSHSSNACYIVPAQAALPRLLPSSPPPHPSKCTKKSVSSAAGQSSPTGTSLLRPVRLRLLTALPAGRTAATSARVSMSLLRPFRLQAAHTLRLSYSQPTTHQTSRRCPHSSPPHSGTRSTRASPTASATPSLLRPTPPPLGLQ